MDIVLEDENDLEQIRTIAKEQIKRMNGTVNQALSLVRSDAFEKDLMVESVELIQLIHELLVEVQPECEQASVDPVVISEVQEVFIISDRKWLKVCIEQLISNAIKYSRPKEGLKKLEVIIEQRQSAVFLHIKDNGLRPLTTARGDGKSYIYSNFNPKYAQMAITILRTYYNFCFAFKFNETMETPAQRLGLTDKQFSLKDIIYLR